ncbi:response regulator [Vulgatibacter sp.]|uniref:response regulator n=1 Tax=Vulgatibacter sp. TaxID=1971226 RepID=UPI0035630F90
MFYESAGPEEISPEILELASFLHSEASSIARTAATLIMGGLPLLGTGARRRLRSLLGDQLLELARHLQSFGDEGPRLYGESQRRYAASRLAEGMALHEALGERAVVHECILVRWSEEKGAIPVKQARILAQSFAEVSSQAAEVYLTFQRAESVAFQEAALLDTIVHHLDEAILVVEPDGTISYVTPALEQIVGLPPRYFIGVQPERLGSLLQRLDLRDRQGTPIPREELPDRKALVSREAQHADFVRMRRMDGTEGIVELYAAPVFAEEGQLRGAIVTLRDRTESARQTVALERAYEDLQTMHARLLSRSRLEAIGELAGSAAHALNNQLNVITLRVRRLLEKPEAAEDAAAVEKSVREIAALVGRLQEFAEAPEAREAEPIDVRKVVETALQMTRAELGPGNPVQLATRLREMPPALAESDALLEFTTALLLGARDASPPGSTVLVETRIMDDHVVLRVVDRGPALSAAQVEQLFEPLAPGGAERALSLSVGRQAVQRWGGEVRVLHEAEGGNAFEVHLLLQGAAAVAHAAEAAKHVEAEAEAEAERRKGAPAPARVHRVLVVDDDVDNASMLADLIRDAEGTEAFTAGTGAEALQVAERSPPEAALVDLLLPDTKGWEVVTELKRRFPDIRVAVVSGLAVTREEREQSGADAVFRKPIDTDELLRFLGF